MTADVLRELVVPLLTAAATWGAIRADLRNLHQQVRDLREDVGTAHERIDRLQGFRAR